MNKISTPKELFHIVSEKLNDMTEYDLMFDYHFQSVKKYVFNKMNIKTDDEFISQLLDIIPEFTLAYYPSEKRQLEEKITLVREEIKGLSEIWSRDMQKQEESKLSHISDIEKEISDLNKQEKETSRVYYELNIMCQLILGKQINSEEALFYANKEDKRNDITFLEGNYSKDMCLYLRSSIQENTIFNPPKNWKLKISELLDTNIPSKPFVVPSYKGVTSGVNNYERVLNSKMYASLIAIKNALISGNVILDSENIIHLQMSGGLMSSIKFHKHKPMGFKDYKIVIRNNLYECFYNSRRGTLNEKDIKNEINEQQVIYTTEGYNTIIKLDESFLFVTDEYYIDFCFSASPFLMDAPHNSANIVGIHEDILEEQRNEE